jgi:hypothetical protein
VPSTPFSLSLVFEPLNSPKTRRRLALLASGAGQGAHGCVIRARILGVSTEDTPVGGGTMIEGSDVLASRRAGNRRPRSSAPHSCPCTVGPDAGRSTRADPREHRTSGDSAPGLVQHLSTAQTPTPMTKKGRRAFPSIGGGDQRERVDGGRQCGALAALACDCRLQASVPARQSPRQSLYRCKDLSLAGPSPRWPSSRPRLASGACATCAAQPYRRGPSLRPNATSRLRVFLLATGGSAAKRGDGGLGPTGRGDAPRWCTCSSPRWTSFPVVCHRTLTVLTLGLLGRSTGITVRIQGRSRKCR